MHYRIEEWQPDSCEWVKLKDSEDKRSIMAAARAMAEKDPDRPLHVVQSRAKDGRPNSVLYFSGVVERRWSRGGSASPDTRRKKRVTDAALAMMVWSYGRGLW